MWDDLMWAVAVSLLVLATAIFVAGIIYEARRGKWWTRTSSIAYRAQKHEYFAPLSPVGYSTFEANKKAARLLQHVCGLTHEQVDAIISGTERLVVIGGATGKRYELFSRFMLPISIPAEHTYLCGGPFNSHVIPRTDNMIAQALYLSCPTTERDFVALCNKTDFSAGRRLIY